MNKNKFLITLILALTFLINGAFASFFVEVVSTNPAPITAGEYGDITLRFTNQGEENKDVNNVVFNIGETKYIKPLENTNYEISKIFYKESITRTFRVFFSQDLEEGYIKVPIKIKSNGIEEVKEITLYVEDSKRKPEILIGKIKAIPNELIRDSSDNLLKIELLNLGEKDAELLKAKLVIQSDKIEESYAFSMEDSISTLKAGSEAELEFTIDIDDNISSGYIDSKLVLSYRTKSGTGTNYEKVLEELEFNLPIDESPYLEIIKVEQIDSFAQGTVDNKIRITIKNTGEEEAQDVRIRISPDISFPLIFDQTSKYLTASLKPGESSVIEFNTQVLDSAFAKKYDSKIILESLVGETRYSQDGSISINVIESKKVSTLLIGKILLVVTLFISLIIGYSVFINKKKNK